MLFDQESSLKRAGNACDNIQSSLWKSAAKFQAKQKLKRAGEGKKKVMGKAKKK
jgi:hypothetical protein